MLSCFLSADGEWVVVNLEVCPMIFQAVPRMPIGIVTKDLERDLVIASSKADHRRQWIIRTSLALALSSAALIFLVILRSDQIIINGIMRSLDKPQAILQAEINLLGQLPASLPKSDRVRLVYANTLIREYARDTTNPVIVATTPIAQPVFRGNGLGVIIYENRRVSRVWLTSHEYQQAWREQEAAIKSWNEHRRSKLPELP